MDEFASVNVEIERSLKDEADAIAREMGMTLSMAILIFVRQMVIEGTMPIRFRSSNDDVKEFHQLIDSIRAENEAKGFLTEEEVHEEIKAYRSERRVNQA